VFTAGVQARASNSEMMFKRGLTPGKKPLKLTELQRFDEIINCPELETCLTIFRVIGRSEYEYRQSPGSFLAAQLSKNFQTINSG